MKFLIMVIWGTMAISAEDLRGLKDFVVANNLFASDIYKELLKSRSGNFLVCPLSVEVVLALLHDGAGGETARQLSTSLHLPENNGKIQQIFKELSPHLESGDKYKLSSANKIYVKDGYKILAQFKSTAVNVFNADIQSIDFGKNEQAAGEMNRWVREKTLGKITHLINKDDMDENTQAILINTMYFHGKWVNEFPARATAKKSFYVNNGQVEVDMMQQLNALNYYESAELKATFLELPYEGNDVTMTIVLPNDKDGLASLEARIGDVLVAPQYHHPLVEITIPKFKIESTTELKPILQSLGILKAFEDDAEFHGIIAFEPLKINKVIQKTFIEVEEQGTMASVATAAELPRPVSEDYEPPPVEKFTADHPFIYYIKIKNILFFVGRFTGS